MYIRYFNVYDFLQVPENNQFNWPPQIVDFVDTLQRACEVQVHNCREKLKQLLAPLAVQIEATINCIKVLLTFPNKQSRYTFLESLLQGQLSHTIASLIYDKEFCSQLTTINDRLRDLDNDIHLPMLQFFLEHLVDLITVHIYFRVDQLIDLKRDADSSYEFRFHVAAAKLILPHHDSEHGDITAVTLQIADYLKQDADIFSLLKEALSRE